MKVLFVSRLKFEKRLSHIVKNQQDSLQNAGLKVDNFTINGKGFNAYLKSVLLLRKTIRHKKYDVIHAHYSWTGLVSALAGAKPLVVSLMGSDTKMGLTFKFAIRVLSLVFWDAVILKSEDMQKNLKLKDSVICPNGVNTAFFKPGDKIKNCNDLGWNGQKVHILFPTNPSRYVKNFPLLDKAQKLLYFSKPVDIHFFENIPHQDAPKYMNASDVVVLTSFWEGSPNVIKEAMACNRPIVSTNVGDVSWLFGNAPGHFLTDFDPHDLADKILSAVQFSKKSVQTNGRERIFKLSIDSDIVAKKIVAVYRAVLEKNKKY